MLDVHAPHTSVHTWRDFFIHIATIVIGLLIAVGLEQTVEAIHNIHQRHQLEEDLHNEALKNLDISTLNLAWSEQDMRWLLDLRARVDLVRAGGEKTGFVYPPPPTGYPADPSHTDRRLPAEAVWNTARENGLVRLLPRETGRFYTSFYRVTDLSADAFEDLRQSWTRLVTFEFRFEDGPNPTQPDLHRMSALQLDQYASLIDDAFIEARNVRRLLKIQRVYTQAAIEQQQGMPPTEEYLSTHPDDFTSPKPAATH